MSKILDFLKAKKDAIVFALGTIFTISASLVMPVSAGAINNSTGELIYDVAALMPDILNLILGIVPVLVTLAIVGFILGLLAKVLGYI